MAEEDEKAHLCRNAVRALGKLAPYVPAATTVLVKKFQSSDAGVRCAAAEAFKKPWPGAVVALPALKRLTADTWRSTREAAQTAVGRLKAIQRIRGRQARRIPHE